MPATFEEGGLSSQSPPSLPRGGRGVFKEGKQNKEIKQGVSRSCLHAGEHSPSSDGTSDGLVSSWLRATLAPCHSGSSVQGQQGSRSQDARRSGLIFSETSSWDLTHTRCPSTGYTSGRVGRCRSRQRKLGGSGPRCYGNVSLTLREHGDVPAARGSWKDLKSFKIADLAKLVFRVLGSPQPAVGRVWRCEGHAPDVSGRG